MFMGQAHSNQRPLALEEMILIYLTANFPEQQIESKEMTKFRREAEASLQVASELRGAILDSAVYEFLRLSGKLL